jgi:hypothetical protein
VASENMGHGRLLVASGNLMVKAVSDTAARLAIS